LKYSLLDQLEETVFDDESQIQELISNLKEYSQEAVKTQEVLQHLIKNNELNLI